MMLLVLLVVAAAIILIPSRNEPTHTDEFCKLECKEQQAKKAHTYCDPTHTYCEQ